MRTSSAVISSRQLVCPRGHTRSKQGEHGNALVRTLALSESGGVYSGELEPNKAIKGLLRAAATCIKPESLVTTQVAPAIRCIASCKVVLPVRSCIFC